MTMNQGNQWKEFQGEMSKHGCCTNAAAQQFMAQNYVKEQQERDIQEAGRRPQSKQENESYIACNGALCKLRDLVSASCGSTSASAKQLAKEHARSSSTRNLYDDGFALSKKSSSNKNRRASFDFSQLRGDITAQPKTIEKRRASKTQRHNFDSMVNNVLDGYVEDSPPSTLARRRPSLSFERMHATNNHKKTRNRRASHQDQGQTNASQLQPRRASVAEAPSLRDAKALSSYLSAFVDSDSEDEKGSISDAKKKRKDQSTRKNGNAVLPAHIQRMIMKPPTSAESCHNQQAGPSDTPTNDAIMTCDAATPEDILVDFPSQPRRRSSLPTSMLASRDEHPSSEEGETRGSMPGTKSGFALLFGHMSWQPNTSFGNSKPLKNGSKLEIEPDWIKISNREHPHVPGDVKKEEILLDFPAFPRRKMSLPTLLPSSCGKGLSCDSDLSDDSNADEFLPLPNTSVRRSSTGCHYSGKPLALDLYQARLELFDDSSLNGASENHHFQEREEPSKRPFKSLDFKEDPNNTREEHFAKPDNWIDHEEDSEDDQQEGEEFVKPANWVDHDEKDSDEEAMFEKPANWVDHDEDDSDDEEPQYGAGNTTLPESRAPDDFERPDLMPYFVALRRKSKELGQIY